MCYFCTLSKENNKRNCIFRDEIPTLKHTKQIPDLDYLFRWSDVEYPVMKGVDILDRPFIILKLIVGKLNIIVMQCFFFGYSLGRSMGYIGTYDSYTNNNNNFNLIVTEGGMNIDQFNLIKDLVNGKIIKLKKNHRLISEDFIGHYIQIYDEKKWKAAKVIQNYWRECRYNPVYRMCGNIQNKNLNEIYKEYEDII